MSLTVLQYTQALFEALSSTEGHGTDIILDNLVKTLKANGDLDKFEKIVEAFEKLVSEKETQGRGTVELAHNLEVNTQLLNKLNSVAGKKLTLQKKVDDDLVGGLVLKVDDLLLDSSVQKELSDLQKHLTD